MVVHVLQVFKSQIVLVLSVVFLEDGSNQFLVLVSVGLSVHCFHELDEADTSCLFGIELSYNFVSGLTVRGEAILSEEELDIVGKEDSHSGRIVCIEDILEIEYVLIGESASDVERGFELSKVFASEADSVHFAAIDF